jgi:uncharacterized protein (DUF1810 family)
MTDPFDLQRFVDAQAPVYPRVIGPPAPRRPPLVHWLCQGE